MIQKLLDDSYRDDPVTRLTVTFSRLPVVHSVVCGNVFSRLLVNVIRSGYTSPGLTQLFPTIIFQPLSHI